MKTVPMKLYLLVAAIVLFTFFSNDFGLVDIQKTAIIIAVGIDKTEDGVALTTQLAVPKGSDRTTGGTSGVEIKSTGKTVSDGINNLQSITGWVPKLVFCNLIVIGEEAAKDDVMTYLNYFMRNEYSSDSCLLVVAHDTAEELITSQSAIDDTSTLAISKLFSEAAQKAGIVMTSKLKDFCVDYYGVSKCGYMPYVRAIDQEGSQDNEGSGPQSGGNGENTNSSEMQKIYRAEETAIFSEGKMVGLLTKEETFAFNILSGKVEAGVIDSMEEGKVVTLSIHRNSGGVELKTDGAPTAELKAEITVRVCCRGLTAPIEDVSSDAVPPDAIKKGTEVLTGYITDLWNTCMESGCDLFYLKRTLYRSSLKKYAEWKDSLLSTVKPVIKAKLSSVK